LPPLQERSVLYAADGSTLAVLHDGENRTEVRLDGISPTLVTAVLDTEDAKFWHHGGVDFRGMLRAARAAGEAPLPTSVTLPPVPSDYATAAVVADLLGDSRLGATADERRARVFGGGLHVRTTIDPNLQRQAEKAVADGVPKDSHLSAALAAVEPGTGAVRALVGGTSFATSQFDAATGGGRQPGSAFKTFTLVAALESGRH